MGNRVIARRFAMSKKALTPWKDRGFKSVAALMETRLRCQRLRALNGLIEARRNAYSAMKLESSPAHTLKTDFA